MSKNPFNVGDIIEFKKSYYGLVVKAHYHDSCIWLDVLNTNTDVRQLNLMFTENNKYSYKVINV